MDLSGGADDAARDAPQHPETLENKTPEGLMATVDLVLGFLQQYGWFVVFGVALAYFLKSKIQPHLDQRRQQTESAAHHKDPDAFMAREEALQAARARMQAKHDEEVQMYAEKQKKKEEERRKAKIDGFDRYQEGKGYRSPLKSNPDDGAEGKSTPGAKGKKKPVYRTNDYNPLLGSGAGGACYRPPRRGGAGGG